VRLQTEKRPGSLEGPGGMGSAPECAGYDGKNHQYGNDQAYDPNKGGFGILVVFALCGHTEPSRNSKYIISIPSFT
jgi:hypothetical protein